MDEITCCQYEDFVRALADETRQAILELLQDREMSGGEITARFHLTQPTISHHLGLLRRGGWYWAGGKASRCITWPTAAAWTPAPGDWSSK